MGAMLLSQVSPADGAVIDEATMLDLVTNNAVQADLNHDGVIDATDIARVVSAMSNGDPSADLNADGAIDAGDLFIVLERIGDNTPSDKLFGPGFQTCRDAADLATGVATVYLLVCWDLSFLPLACANPYTAYFGLSLGVFVGVTCTIDAFF